MSPMPRSALVFSQVFLLCVCVSRHGLTETLRTSYPVFIARDDVIDYYIHGAVLQYNVSFRHCQGDLPLSLQGMLTYTDVPDAGFGLQQFNYPYYRLYLMAERQANGSDYKLTEPVVRVVNLTMVTDQTFVLALADFHSRTGVMLTFGAVTCPYGNSQQSGLTFLAVAPRGAAISDLKGLTEALQEGARVFYCVHSQLCVASLDTPHNASSSPPPAVLEYEDYQAGWIKEFDITAAEALRFTDRAGDFYDILVEVSVYPGNMADVVVSQVSRGRVYPWPIQVERKFCALGAQGGIRFYRQ